MQDERDFDMAVRYYDLINAGISHFAACDIIGLGSDSMLKKIRSYNASRHLEPMPFTKEIAGAREMADLMQGKFVSRKPIMNEVVPLDITTHDEMMVFYSKLKNGESLIIK